MSLPQGSLIDYRYNTTTSKLVRIDAPEELYDFVYDDEGGADDTGNLTPVTMTSASARWT